MCMFSAPKPQPMIMPPEVAAMKQPDAGLIQSDQRRRLEDRQRAKASTILAGGMPDSQNAFDSTANTAGKTLLGA